MGSEPKLRFVTASLKVNYLLPTPLGVELVARGRVKDAGRRKVTVSVDVIADGRICANGEVVAVLMPEGMKRA